LHSSFGYDGGGHEPGRELAAAADDVIFYLFILCTKYEYSITRHSGRLERQGQRKNPLFCLKDVCRILEIGNPSDLKRRLDEKGVQLIDYHALDSNEGTVQGNTMTNFIDEPNLYRCIFTSRKSVARMFQKWVFDEVLPAIRRHGAYATSETIDHIMQDPEYGAALLHRLKKEREARVRLEEAKQSLMKEVDEMKPMADYCRMVLDSPQTVTRAADWAEKEISDAACWLALHRRVQGDLATRLRFMMPRHSGKRKVMHHTRMMELTVGMGRYQIEMVLKRKPDCEAMSDEIDDAMECMVAWMRENAYMRQMQ
jgi:prophage antirepressor-like protein